jgi:uroporphyrin-3 C-methyltransferase
VSGVVSVRRSDEAVRPLIAPEAQYFLRANLALQLQAARIALLRGQQTLYDQSLDDAASWLNRYYDTNSTPVRSALQTVSEARQNVMPVSLPDISGSLRLLREYRVLSATDRQAPADKEPASEDEASR